MRADFSYLFFFKRSLYPAQKRKKSKKTNRKNKADSPSRVQEADKHGRLRALGELRALLERVLARAPGTFTLRVRRLTLNVGSDDPAKTALLYGSACTAFSLLFEWLDRVLFTLRRERGSDFGVRADFEADRITLDADLRLTTTPFRILRLALATVIPHFFKKRKRKKIKNSHPINHHKEN